MAKKFIVIPGFKGGLADDLFDDLEKQTYQTAKDLDVYTNQKILTPHVKLANDAGVTNTNKIVAIIKSQNTAGGREYKALGDDGSGKLRFFKATNLTDSTTWTSVHTSTAGSLLTTRMWFVEFKNFLFFWNSASVLSKKDLSDDSASGYTESARSSLASAGPLFVHEGLGKLFYAYSNKIGFTTTTDWSGSDDGDAKLVLDDKYIIRSLDSFGQFLLIGAAERNESKTSKIFIWDGSATTVDDIIDLGDIGLCAVRNVNNIIHILSVTNPTANTRILGSKVRLYNWSGGRVDLKYELDLQQTAALNLVPALLDTAVDVQKDTLYFGLRGQTANSIGIDNLIYAYGRSSSKDPKIFTPARLTTASGDFTVNWVKIIDGGIVVTTYDGTNYKCDTSHANTPAGTKSSNGVYESNAFPLNSGLPAQIKRIYINHKPLPPDCGFTVALKLYGHYPWGGTPSSDTYTDLITDEGSGETKGKTQSTDNAQFTEISVPSSFKAARFAQIKISFDEVSGTDAPEIIFPILIEVETEISRP